MPRQAAGGSLADGRGAARAARAAGDAERRDHPDGDPAGGRSTERPALAEGSARHSGRRGRRCRHDHPRPSQAGGPDARHGHADQLRAWARDRAGDLARREVRSVRGGPALHDPDLPAPVRSPARRAHHGLGFTPAAPAVVTRWHADPVRDERRPLRRADARRDASHVGPRGLLRCVVPGRPPGCLRAVAAALRSL